MAVLPGAAPPAAPVRPPQAAGLIAQARLRVLAARKLLESVVPILGSAGDDGKKVLTAVKALADFSGEQADGLLRSEHQAMGQAVAPVPPPGAPPQGMPMRGPNPCPASMSPGAPTPVSAPAG